ncbi:hypothetical protein J2S00_003083 [Caldalkalibacillus uzonensis]|uniref:Uncharacterized protein n=1 Tax=Caldalkalibacillus uzonensis TaxID=353224 RepID=A0ABU0CVZ6_9BACI|nr:hypothetical protein [Caldalkalibacillus uzonensis]MDQ0340278.1 hypothetical protein [Caldalkalibacillus uzonensis]
MTRSEAQMYLDRTNWYELRRYVTGEPVPRDVEKKREEAYEVLKKGEDD